MKRRRFLQILGTAVAAAAVRPSALLPAASGGPVAPCLAVVGETGPESFAELTFVARKQFAFLNLSNEVTRE